MNAAKKAAVKKATAKKATAKKATVAKPAEGNEDAATLISRRVAELSGWRGDTLAGIRKLIHEADPDVVEAWKWNVPVWSHDGILCTGEAYKAAVKLTFPRGASLKDPRKVFNASLEGNARRAIDIHEGERLDAAAFKALIQEAVAANTAAAGAKRRK